MYINTQYQSFEPDDFTIINFYGKETCFMWCKNYYVCFPYEYSESTKTLDVLGLPPPGVVKKIRNYNTRAFFLMNPTMIYKITEKLAFTPLSKTGLELGSDFAEVLSINGGKILFMEDKRTKTLKNLFPINADLTKIDIHTVSLCQEDTESSFFKLLADKEECRNVCLVSHEKKLFKFQNTVRLIYNTSNVITEMKPITKNSITVGIMLNCDGNHIILLYVVGGTIKYDKVYLNTGIKSICIVADKDLKNDLLIIHTDGIKTYYSKKAMNESSVVTFKTQKTYFKSMIFYKSKYLVYLREKEILQIPIENLFQISEEENKNFSRLEHNMLRELEEIINTISIKAQELKKLEKQMVLSKNLVKRINLFAHQDHVDFNPISQVERFPFQDFLVINYKDKLPEDTVVVSMMKSEGKNIFAMKKVDSPVTKIQMPVNCNIITPKLRISTDLISVKNYNGPWCLIKNYITKPLPTSADKIHLSTETIKYLKDQLSLLKGLRDGCLVVTLSKLKSKIRNTVGKI